MGSGDKHHLNFHHGKKEVRDIPKGCLAIMVGQGEDHQRFVVPVIYFNHPLFMKLLKEAEDEYGFDQKGTITIPCHVEKFRYVQGIINKEISLHHHHQVSILRIIAPPSEGHLRGNKDPQQCPLLALLLSAQLPNSNVLYDRRWAPLVRIHLVAEPLQPEDVACNVLPVALQDVEASVNVEEYKQEVPI
ncbi:hypothetical protein HHK36_001369 [Tetracentron sinense]|uniref:Small auxin up regulated protein n=1 Tax=Tetracentron sinense TaxID=13715 RepID=A0A835DRZ1_TETSI|nr:hypothetical protein HHK36_001369 [Tetracentron sinense]